MKSPYKEYPLVISFNFLVPIYNNITPTRVTKTKKNGILILDQVVPSLPRAKDRYSINCCKKYNFSYTQSLHLEPVISFVFCLVQDEVLEISSCFFTRSAHTTFLSWSLSTKFQSKLVVPNIQERVLFWNQGRDMTNMPSLYMTFVWNSIWLFHYW